MHEGQRLFRAVLQHPEDHARRLVLADWLEEQGADDLAAAYRQADADAACYRDSGLRHWVWRVVKDEELLRIMQRNYTLKAVRVGGYHLAYKRLALAMRELRDRKVEAAA